MESGSGWLETAAITLALLLAVSLGSARPAPAPLCLAATAAKSSQPAEPDPIARSSAHAAREASAALARDALHEMLTHD